MLVKLLHNGAHHFILNTFRWLSKLIINEMGKLQANELGVIKLGGIA